MLRILSWNIRQGGGSRLLKITSRLTTLAAEVVVLSEYRNNESGRKIRANLLASGYRFQLVSNAKTADNSVAIFSKLPFNGRLHPDSDENYSANVLSAEFEAFTVIGMYLPHKKKHKLFDFLLDCAASEVPHIMVGDFNSGKNYIDQVGNSFWYEDKLLALEADGYQDAFRYKHGQVKEYSWYSHQGNGYRYDHTYVHKNLLAISSDCYYLHEWREEGLSDHSPMVLELG